MDWSLSVPGGVTVRADGKVSLLRVAVQPSENRLWINYATKPGQDSAEMATHLVAVGFTNTPAVFLNGTPLPKSLSATNVNGNRGYIVPLSGP
jgi:hypothetical protein